MKERKIDMIILIRNLIAQKKIKENCRTKEKNADFCLGGTPCTRHVNQINFYFKCACREVILFNDTKCVHFRVNVSGHIQT